MDTTIDDIIAELMAEWNKTDMNDPVYNV